MKIWKVINILTRENGYFIFLADNNMLFDPFLFLILYYIIFFIKTLNYTI
jgi:hypothetical protein